MRACLVLLATAVLLDSNAQSNLDPAHALSVSELIGPLNWIADTESGAVINQYYCSGYVYGSSVGWISLSSGVPGNGFHFQNNSASEYGVNVSPSGELSGFAYGANIGWINFPPAGQARIDWNTGELSGSAWSANADWIPLRDASHFLKVKALPALPDTDNDGLPDAWELDIAGTLTKLSGDTDSDGDGQTDFQEYVAGTNPLNADDYLSLRITVNSGTSTLLFPTKAAYVYRVEQRSAFGTGIWVSTGNPVITGTGASVTLPLESNPANVLFYRVVAYPPLTPFDDLL